MSKAKRLTRREHRVLTILTRHATWSGVADEYEPEARSLVAIGKLEDRRRHPDAFTEFRVKVKRT